MGFSLETVLQTILKTFGWHWVCDSNSIRLIFHYRLQRTSWFCKAFTLFRSNAIHSAGSAVFFGPKFPLKITIRKDENLAQRSRQSLYHRRIIRLPHHWRWRQCGRTDALGVARYADNEVTNYKCLNWWRCVAAGNWRRLAARLRKFTTGWRVPLFYLMMRTDIRSRIPVKHVYPEVGSNALHIAAATRACYIFSSGSGSGRYISK
jgi:hypothetical protein